MLGASSISRASVYLSSVTEHIIFLRDAILLRDAGKLLVLMKPYSVYPATAHDHAYLQATALHFVS